MLATTTALHDVANVEAFVRDCLNRSSIDFDPGEFEDLVCEGLAIMYDLAGKFEPHRPGYDGPGRFSGYAAYFLPKRLGDAWHRSHPNHRYVTDPLTGKRYWHYDPPAVSLDDLVRPARGDDDGGGADRQLSRARRIADFVPALATPVNPSPVATAPAFA